MRIKLDENMPHDAAEFLKTQGCDVETVLSEQLGGAPDPSVVSAAKTENRVLLTFDKGIANTTNPLYSGHAGIILVRLKHPGINSILSVLQKHFPALADQNLGGRIAVISVSGVRIR